jgi:ATP-dependent Clp protease, protease subunit
MPAMAGPETGGAGMTDNVYQSLLRNRIVFLGSEVKDENANALCAQMLLLNAEDPEADIYLYINSPGGSVTGVPRKMMRSSNNLVYGSTRRTP